MTIGVEIDGTPVSVSRIIIGGSISQSISSLPMSADGTGSQGGITFDDPDGSYTHRGWSIVKVDEDDCTVAPTLFYGGTWNRKESRGTYRDGPGRIIDTTINDSNVFLSLRILGGDTATFPKDQTDTDRIAALLADASLDGLVQDLGLVATTGLPLPQLYAQGMTPGEVLSDIASHYGQIFFTYWDQTAEAVGLFFDFADSTTFTCALSISNVLSDISLDANEVVTGDVYPPQVDGSLDITPEDVYSRVRFKYAGGVVWRSNATTAAAFFPEPLRYGSVQVENDRIGELATATTFADHFLATHSTERVKVTFTVRLPSTRVGEIQAGMRISLRFSHLTGFETATWTRIEVINRIPVDVFPPAWDVTCECSTAGIKSGYGTGGGSTDPFPYQPPSAPPNIVQQVSGEGNIHFPVDPTAGNTLIYRGAGRGSLGSWDYAAQGYTLGPDGIQTQISAGNEVAVVYKLATGAEDNYLGGLSNPAPGSALVGTWIEVEGEWVPDTHDYRQASSTTVSTPNISVQANSLNLIVSAQGAGGAYDSVAGTLSYTPAAGWTEDLDTYNTSGAPSTLTLSRINIGAGSISGGGVNSGNGGLSGDDYRFVAQIVSFVAAGGGLPPDPPAAGQEVPWTAITLTTVGGVSTGTTAFPYASGSLKIKVDGVLISPASYTETDNTTGDFALSWIVDTDEVVLVSYQAL